MADTFDYTKASRALLFSDYHDLGRALAHLRLLQEASRLCIVQPDDTVEVPLAAMKDFLVNRQLPEQLFALLDCGEAIGRARREHIIEPPTVQKVTPFLRVPFVELATEFPIHEFVNGKVDDVVKLQRRKSLYAVFEQPYDLKITLLPVSDDRFIGALKSNAPLDAMVEIAPDITSWLRLLCSLAGAGIVLWLRPAAAGNAMTRSSPNS